MNLSFQDSIEQQVRNVMLDQTAISAEQRERVKEVEKNVDALLADYAKEKHHIANNADRSAQGREKDLAALKQSMIERLRRITDAEVSQIAKRLGELETQLRPQPPATDPIVQEMREAEIRAHLRTMDELRLTVLYQDWAVTGQDDDSMRATEGAPAAFPLISDPSVLAAGKQARASRQSPQAAETLKRLRQMQGLLKNIIASAEAQIGLPADDMLSVIARGEAATTD